VTTEAEKWRYRTTEEILDDMRKSIDVKKLKKRFKMLGMDIQKGTLAYALLSLGNKK